MAAQGLAQPKQSKATVLLKREGPVLAPESTLKGGDLEVMIVCAPHSQKRPQNPFPRQTWHERP